MSEVKTHGLVIRYELAGVILAIFIQTAGAIWWAGGVSTTLNYMKTEIIRLNSILATDKVERSSDYKELSTQVDKMDIRLTTLEAKIKK